MPNPSLSEHERALLQPYFDEQYYLQTVPLLSDLQIPPLDHYHFFGWKEGRNPSRTFDTTYYLKSYPDVAEAGVNPLLHYAVYGEQQGRQPRRRLDQWRTQLERLYRSRPDTYQVFHGNALSPSELGNLLAAKLQARTLVISVSHDDYGLNVGGIQNVIHDEQRAAADEGWHYLHLAPAEYTPALSSRKEANGFRVVLRLDGERLCLTSMDSVLEAIRAVRDRLQRTEVVVHHLMSHSPELISALIRAAECENPVVWCHDFFAACTSYTLLRNDVVFCGGPSLNSGACLVCRHGGDRRRHVSRMREFFRDVRPTLLAPSQAALDGFLKSTDYSIRGTAVVPLARLVTSLSGQRRATGDVSAPLRIAHLGGRSFHKGWPIFEDLAIKYASDLRYRFFHLGYGDTLPLTSAVTHVPVTVTRQARNAMVDAVARHRIDIALICSPWPETFCFTAHEALAGGAFVVTHEGAGNVATICRALLPEQGLVMRTPSDLFSLFAGPEICNVVGSSLRRFGAVVSASSSIGWLARQRRLDTPQPLYDTVSVLG